MIGDEEFVAVVDGDPDRAIEDGYRGAGGSQNAGHGGLSGSSGGDARREVGFVLRGGSDAPG